MSSTTIGYSLRGYRRQAPKWERRDMTVCIAAVCERNTDDPKILMCCDTQLSTHLGKASVTKLRPVRLRGGGWYCLVSGIESDYLTTLRLLRGYFETANDIDETNVLQLARDALSERKREKADELIQTKFGIPYSEFLATGKSRFPEDIFRNVITEVELIQLNADFLIAGFSENRFPMLIETTGASAVIREDFAVCGEGSSLAQASLLDREHHSMSNFSRTVYSVFEAKRFAQGSPSVGFTTSLMVIHKDLKGELLTWDGVTSLDRVLAEFGRKPLSKEMPLSLEWFTPTSSPSSDDEEE